MKKSSIVCGIALLGLVSAQADIYTSTNVGGALNDAAVWSSGQVPAAGHTYQVVTQTAEINFGKDQTFEGDLQLVSDRIMWNSTSADTTLTIGSAGSLTMESGGAIRVHNTRSASVDLNQRTFTLNGGLLDLAGKAGNMTIENGYLAGSGSVEIKGTGTMTLSGLNTTGFDGMFDLNSGTLVLSEVATGSFGLDVGTGSVYANSANVALADLVINGNTVAADAYTRTELLAYGQSEYSEDWSALVADNGGTITVIPEPATIGMLGMAAAGLLVVRRRFTV